MKLPRETVALAAGCFAAWLGFAAFFGIRSFHDCRYVERAYVCGAPSPPRWSDLMPVLRTPWEILRDSMQNAFMVTVLIALLSVLAFYLVKAVRRYKWPG
jgi:hypothetical protein